METRGKNFTLIELLITIAMITILAGMLLPALNAARKKGKAVSCIANQKQIGLNIAMYSHDWNDCFFLYWQDASSVFSMRGDSSAKNSSNYAQYLAYSGYIPKKHNPVYQCTEQMVKTNADGTYYNYIYGVNANVYYKGKKYTDNVGQWYWKSESGGDKKMVRFTGIPNDLVLLADTRRGELAVTTGYHGGCSEIYASTAANRYWAVHKGSLVNVLFPDLHAGSISIEKIREHIGNTGLFYYGEEN